MATPRGIPIAKAIMIPRNILLRLGNEFSISDPVVTRSEKAFSAGSGAKSAKF